MNRGTVGSSTQLSYGLGKYAAMELQKKRTERRWAARAGGVEVTQVPPEEAEARSTRARTRRRKTSPAALRKAPARPENFPAENMSDRRSVETDARIEDLLGEIFG
jgi:hypothetical protein